MYTKFIGTGVALVTPFDRELNIDYGALKRVVCHTIKKGVDYLVVQGTTGESVTVSEEEKLEILKVVNDISEGKPIVIGIGGNDTEKVRSQIDALSNSHFDAVLSVCPYYNKPTQTGLINHFEKIADKSPKPLILYNVPGRTSVNLSAESTAILSEHPNIIGIKEASGDFNQAVEIMKKSNKDFLLISGDDFLTLPLLSIGATGVISVLANALTKQMCEIVNYGLKNHFDKAREVLYSISVINGLMYKEGNPAGVKGLLEIIGICSSYVRPPLAKASEHLIKEINTAYNEIK
jgi:4-hydroxy-tetrahydrodipicolinate synthase